MPRFMKIKGKAGVLVSDPHAIAAGIRRYVGQERIADPPTGATFAQMHAPIEQVVRWHVDLVSAGKAGDLDVLGVVEANDAEAAAKAFAPKASAKAEKVSG